MLKEVYGRYNGLIFVLIIVLMMVFASIIINYNRPYISGMATNNADDCDKIKWNIRWTGVNDEVGILNNNTNKIDNRFICYNSGFNECGWELDNSNFANKIQNEGVVGSWKCDLANKKWLNTNIFNCSSGEICLDIYDEVIGNTSNKLLGQALIVHEVLPYALRNTNFKELVRRIKPGMSRVTPPERYYWERSNNQNYWSYLPGHHTKSFTVENGRAYFKKEADKPKEMLIAHQRLSPSLFIPGKRYNLSFNYETRNLEKVPFNVWEIRGARLGVSYLDDYEWWNGASSLGGVNVPNGNNSGTASFEFNYTTTQNKRPAFVSLDIGMTIHGELWIDNVKLSLADNLNQNLIADSDFNLTKTPNGDYLGRFTTANLDENINFLKDIGIEPIVTQNFDMLRPMVLDPNDANALESAVLTDPEFEKIIQMNLDMIKYANIEKNYGIKYWEFGNEPEIWWTWINSSYNYGIGAERNYKRGKLYGKMYSRFAGRAKKIDSSIKIGIAVPYLDNFSKSALDGFFDGVNEYEALTDASDPSMPVPKPDFFAPHPYQLRAWGNSPRCPANDTKTCIDNLFIFKNTANQPYCPDNSYVIRDWQGNAETISYLEPFFKCVTNYLKTRGMSNIIYIPTEWQASGSTGTPYGTFGSEIWTADRIGRFAKAGVFAPQNFNIGQFMITDSARVYSPYFVYFYYSKFLNSGNMNLLKTITDDESKVTVYAFQKDSNSKLNLVIVNLWGDTEGANVKLNLPNKFETTAKKISLSCSGNNCIYDRNATEINGYKIDTTDNANLLNVLDQIEPVNQIISSTFNMPKYSIWFLTVNEDNACGDLRCEGDESCSNCAADCGSCSGGGGSGSSGGGGGGSRGSGSGNDNSTGSNKSINLGIDNFAGLNEPINNNSEGSYCGDKLCDASLGENSDDCPDDCNTKNILSKSNLIILLIGVVLIIAISSIIILYKYKIKRKDKGNDEGQSQFYYVDPNLINK